MKHQIVVQRGCLLEPDFIGMKRREARSGTGS
jgi:hypothetical protein